MNRLPLLACLAAACAVAPTLARHAPEPAPLTIVAGNGTAGFADGVGAEAQFNKPIRLAPFGSDAVVVSDIYNHAIRVVSKDGRVRTIAGAPDRKGHPDGPAATARFASPHGVGIAADGRIAVAEAEGQTLRAADAARRRRRRLRGDDAGRDAGQIGSADGPGRRPRSSIRRTRRSGPPTERSTRLTSATRPIRRVKDGEVETVAGAAADKMVYPMDIAWMTDGRMVIADAGANLLRTWRAGETLGTLAVPGASPRRTAWRRVPTARVYVADMKSHRVLAIDAKGAVTTVAGVEGQAGSDASHLNRPAAVLVHAGWLWIADLDNHRIWRCRSPATVCNPGAVLVLAWPCRGGPL